ALAGAQLPDARHARPGDTLVLRMPGAVDEQPARFGLAAHVRDELLHELVRGDRLAERVPLRRVRYGRVDGGLSLSDRAGGDGVATRVERGHRDLEAVTDRTEAHRVGDAHVVEDQLARVR